MDHTAALPFSYARLDATITARHLSPEGPHAMCRGRDISAQNEYDG